MIIKESKQNWIILMAVLKPNQDQAAYLLATGNNCKKTAEIVGVTPETISKWKQNNTFIAKYNEYRKELVDSILDAVRSAATVALSNLQDLMENAESESVRLRACIEILKLQGFSKPEMWGWGIGYTTPLEVEQSKVSIFSGLG